MKKSERDKLRKEGQWFNCPFGRGLGVPEELLDYVDHLEDALKQIAQTKDGTKKDGIWDIYAEEIARQALEGSGE